jgi:SAM-dependent methyltransferase
MADESIAAFWEARWAEGPGWDIGEAAPPFRSALAQGELGPPGRAAVIGCGAGHDALLLARAGFRVTGFDFAEPAISAARASAAAAGFGEDDPRLSFERLDLFSLPADPRRAGAFDLVLEHTCFCAIDRARRGEYVDVARTLLKPGARLVGLFYLRPLAEVGPPWPASEAEIDRLFLEAPGGFLRLFARAPADSIERRQGREWLAAYARR